MFYFNASPSPETEVTFFSRSQFFDRKVFESYLYLNRSMVNHGESSLHFKLFFNGSLAMQNALKIYKNISQPKLFFLKHSEYNILKESSNLSKMWFENERELQNMNQNSTSRVARETYSRFNGLIHITWSIHPLPIRRRFNNHWIGMKCSLTSYDMNDKGESYEVFWHRECLTHGRQVMRSRKTQATFHWQIRIHRLLKKSKPSTVAFPMP